MTTAPSSSLPRARTKIVATVGPACRQPAQLAQLILSGVSVFRLNTAHSNREQLAEIVRDIRQASRTVQREVGILLDLAGPKIRLGELAEDPCRCEQGAEFTIVRGEKPRQAKELTSNYERLVDELSVGDVVMLADGTVGMQVVGKEADSVRCRVTNAGTIRSRQGINLPGVALSVPAMTEEDRQNALWATEHEVDFVSLSFVRSPVEILQLKDMLLSRSCTALVIAKIEKREALERLDEIVAASDGVMVARGDLGVEIDVAETPVAQKRIIASCQRFVKPVIVATQMLDSMHRSPRPTRAEVNDVANAILDGADACMLSGETAIGEYPREAVEMMNRIMAATERILPEHSDVAPPSTPLSGVHPITAAVVSGAAQIAEHLAAKMLVVATRSGGTARVLAKHRSLIPMVGVSDCEATLRHMCLFWGFIPLAGAPLNHGPQLRSFVADWGIEAGTLAAGDRIVYITGSEVVPTAHNLVVVHEVE
ncbi:MAG: pyruvate kinase [Pirellulales bacterium]